LFRCDLSVGPTKLSHIHLRPVTCRAFLFLKGGFDFVPALFRPVTSYIARVRWSSILNHSLLKQLCSLLHHNRVVLCDTSDLNNFLSSMASPSSSNLQLPNAGYVPVPSTIGQVRDQVGLAARIEHQRAKILALQHEAEERRRRETRQAEDRRRELESRRVAKVREREQRQLLSRQQKEDRRAAKVREREQRQLLFRQQEGQRGRDTQAWDESVIQAHLQHKAADLARKAEDELLHQRRLAAEEDRKRALFHQQEEQRRRDRQARDESALQAHLRHKAAELARKAQHRAAKLRDAERRRELRRQQDEQRRVDRQRRDESAMQAHLRHKAAAEAQKQQDRQLREVASHEEARTRTIQRAIRVDERRALQRLQDDHRRQDRYHRDRAGMQAHLRHEALAQAQRVQQKSQTQVQTLAFDGVLPSFLDQEYQYMKQASTNFPEMITPSIQMECMEAYQKAISDASSRLPCGICGGLFQEDDITNVGLQNDDLQYFLKRTKTAPDSCAVKDSSVSMCSTCNVAIVKQKIPPLSAGNFVNCLFCQDYPAVLKDLNTVEEAFIARAHVLGVFLKLTSGAKRGMSYRGSRGHSVAVRQDPSGLLKILPTRRLRDHTTITVSWDRGTPPSEENLARFCSVNKAKVSNALLWLCANNPVYRSVTIDYSVLDSWPDHHIPQEIRDAFIALGSEAGSTQAPVTDEREGYATSLQDGLFENDLDAEVEDAEPGSILSRSFFSDLHGQEAHPTPATLATLQAILQESSDGSSLNDNEPGDDEDNDQAPDDSTRPPHISYKTSQDLPLINSFTEPDYFTAAFPTLFPFGIGGHLGDANGNRPETISLKAFAKYAMLHHSLL
jgi:hypothetical protein